MIASAKAVTSRATAIDVKALSKNFGTGDGKVTALDNVSLVIRDNEFFTLLGPSGCGKTTLLRMIAGFDYPDDGQILLRGEDIARLPPFRRPINTVFQSYALFPHMTVGQNIAFGLRMLGRPNAEIQDRLAEMLKLVRMEDLKDRRIAQISGGQQQRVALARALAPKPEVLLLDEPLSALDYKLRKDMQIELKRMQAETGITFVFVTHDQEEALTMSDRIAVMHRGQVLQVGAPRDIYGKPADRFVASFIGTPAMTLIDGAVAVADQRHVLHLGELAIALPLQALDLEQGSEKVTVGVRPEDVLIGTGDDKALIRIVEPTGHESIVTLNAGGVTFTARVPGDRRLTAGETVPFELRRDNIHVFDQVSGRRLNSHG